MKIKTFDKETHKVVADGLALQAMICGSVMEVMEKSGNPVDAKTIAVALQDVQANFMELLCDSTISLLLANVNMPNYTEVEESESDSYTDMYGISLRNAITDYYLRHGAELPDVSMITEKEDR